MPHGLHVPTLASQPNYGWQRSVQGPRYSRAIRSFNFVGHFRPAVPKEHWLATSQPSFPLNLDREGGHPYIDTHAVHKNSHDSNCQ
jgi:hypothetical protein